jgi:HEAT repeat protein
MTDAEWEYILSDLHAVANIERAVKAVETLDKVPDESDIPRLRFLVQHGANFFVREAAASPLARLEGARSLPLLFQALSKGKQEDHDNDGLCAIIADLLEVHQLEVSPLLLRMIATHSTADRENAAWALGWLPAEIAVAPLSKALRDDCADVRAAAAGSLSNSRFKGYAGVVEGLIEALRDGDEQVRISSAAALGYLGDRRAMPSLKEVLHDPCERVRFFAAYALEKLDKGS